MDETQTYDELASPAADTRLREDADGPAESGSVDAPPTAAKDAGLVESDGDDAAPRGDHGEPSQMPVEDDGMPSTEVMREAMKAVMDPEIGYNVVDLGLVYDIDKQGDGQVDVTMTLTTMGCPLTELIHQQVSVVLGALPGVDEVDVDFTFSPPWSPEMISDDVRAELRAMGMSI